MIRSRLILEVTALTLARISVDHRGLPLELDRFYVLEVRDTGEHIVAGPFKTSDDCEGARQGEELADAAVAQHYGDSTADVRFARWGFAAGFNGQKVEGFYQTEEGQLYQKFYHLGEHAREQLVGRRVGCSVDSKSNRMMLTDPEVPYLARGPQERV